MVILQKWKRKLTRDFKFQNVPIFIIVCTLRSVNQTKSPAETMEISLIKMIIINY